jgi:hypothetical protein
MQADYQRSRFWRKEFGGILTRDGGVVRAPARNRHSLMVEFTRGMFNAANNRGGAVASYHTHWARGGVHYYINNKYDIVNKTNAPYHTTTSNGPSPDDITGIASHFGGDHLVIDRNHFYYYNTSAVVNNDSFLFRYFPIY